MGNLKPELKNTCSWTIPATKEEFDSGAYEGVFFDSIAGEYRGAGYSDDCDKKGARAWLNDDDCDNFAQEHGLAVFEDEDEEELDHVKTIEKIEKACDCKIVWNENANSEEVFFNESKQLYIISAGLWDIDPTPRETQENYRAYISEFIPNKNCSIDKYLEYDDDRMTYEQVKFISDKNHNWRNMFYADPDWISGSVMLTSKQADSLKEHFYLCPMSDLLSE